MVNYIVWYHALRGGHRALSCCYGGVFLCDFPVAANPTDKHA